MTHAIDPDRLAAAHTAAADYYRSQLANKRRTTRAAAYLRSRGIDPDTATDTPWTIGYAPPGWRNLRNQLANNGFTDAELLAAGLVATASNGNLIDVFRDRVMFPIRTPAGQVIAFTGRDLSGHEKATKYRNTAATALYTKSQHLYGLAEQLTTGTAPTAVFIVEGPADVRALAHMVSHLSPDSPLRGAIAIAPCGTALTPDQVQLLKGRVPDGTPIIAAFDADTAGANAAEKAHGLLADWPGPIDGIALAPGQDPAALVARHRGAAGALLQQARMPLVDLVIDQRLHGVHLHEVESRLAALRSVAPLIADLEPGHASRLLRGLTTTLDLDPITAVEIVYPPDEDEIAAAALVVDEQTEPGTAAPAPLGPSQYAHTGNTAETTTQAAPAAARFPTAAAVGHDYAHLSPDNGAATWVQHDPASGHTAWVIAEGITDTVEDRAAARLAAEVAGRAAILVGANNAVTVARTAVNAHFSDRAGGPQGNATITVLTSFDGDQPRAGTGRFTLAWTGDNRAHGLYDGNRWFAPLTTDHTLAARAAGRGEQVPAGTAGLLTSTVRGGPIGTNRLDLPMAGILLTSRTFNHVARKELLAAVSLERSTTAIGRLTELGEKVGGVAAAIVVRPAPERSAPLTAAGLAMLSTAAAKNLPVPVRPKDSAARRAPAAASIGAAQPHR